MQGGENATGRDTMPRQSTRKAAASKGARRTKRATLRRVAARPRKAARPGTSARGRKPKRSPSDNPRSGSTLESLLREEGLYEEASATAIKEVIAWQVQQAMEEQGISKAEMARRMKTSRSSLDRFLDPENDSVTLSTLFRAATVLGVELRVELIGARD